MISLIILIRLLVVLLKKYTKFKLKNIYLNKACKFIKKETLAQVFSCGFCEISKNTFSYRPPPVATSVTGICGQALKMEPTHRLAKVKKVWLYVEEKIFKLPTFTENLSDSKFLIGFLVTIDQFDSYRHWSIPVYVNLWTGTFKLLCTHK